MEIEDWQTLGIVITLIISVFGLILAFMSYRVSKDAQRNNLREKVFDRQFDFFMKLNEHTGYIETVLGDHNHHLTDKEKSFDVLADKLNELDVFFTQNELIVPEKLYKGINDLIIMYSNCYNSIRLNREMLDKNIAKELTDLSIDIQLDISEYLGLENLSKENARLGRKVRV